jgi:hypothetical protein
VALEFQAGLAGASAPLRERAARVLDRLVMMVP